ncbi:MAG: RNA-binding protein [Dehalococcoidales bacterium]|nr:RNA-binding protein [Dehalococcoidales bacterium]
MKIYVGNLSYQVTEEELRQEFEAYGAVTSASIVIDKYDNRPRGFAFVEMPTKAEAEAAITGLNGKVLQDKSLMVNEARPKSDSRGPSGNRGSFNNRGGHSGGRQSGGFGGRGRSNRY